MFTFRDAAPLPLEAGGELPGLCLAYTDQGPADAPVVWVCHALTANADVFAWWPGLFGPNDLFHPGAYRILCVNIPGSCYGSTGPLSPDPATGAPYGHSFPVLTVRDIVAALERLRIHLGIARIHLLIGGSLGGQQAMEWAYLLGRTCERLVLIATNARHSAWGIALNEAQRMAIEADATWPTSSPEAGDAGMRAARAMALISYRHYGAYGQTQTDPSPRLGGYRAQSYQRYQGEKLSHRFNAFSYYRLSQTMDSHHMGRGRPSTEAALGLIAAATLVIGIDTDVLFPPEEQAFLAAHIPGSRFACIHSAYGHDGFLIETVLLSEVVGGFLREVAPVALRAASPGRVPE
jgi:homoserine O-acetyltransferase